MNKKAEALQIYNVIKLLSDKKKRGGIAKEECEIQTQAKNIVPEF